MNEQTIHMIDSKTKPWGAWATVGWGLCVMVAFFVFQGVVYLVFAAVEVVKNPGIGMDEIKIAGKARKIDYIGFGDGSSGCFNFQPNFKFFKVHTTGRDVHLCPPIMVLFIQINT